MKKIVLLVAFCLGIGNAFAQDVDKLRDEGDAALKDKNYAEVVAKYSEYLKLNEYKDTARIYNCAFSANQAKQYEEAAKYFDMALNYKYNMDDSYVGKAMALRSLGKNEEFLTTVEAGLKDFPENANLEKLLYTHCMKQGQAAQKSGKIDAAEESFKKVLTVSNKKYQENALYSLGAMLYGQGANALVKINPLATSDPAKYKTEKAKADAQLKEAKEYLEQAQKLNPENANVKKLVDAIAATQK